MKTENFFNEDLKAQSINAAIVDYIYDNLDVNKKYYSEQFIKTEIILIICNLLQYEHNIICKQFSRRHKNTFGRSLTLSKDIIEQMEDMGFLFIDRGKNNLHVANLESMGFDVSEYKHNPTKKGNRGTSIYLLDKGRVDFQHFETDYVKVVRQQRDKAEEERTKSKVKLYKNTAFNPSELAEVAQIEKEIAELNNVCNKGKIFFVDKDGKTNSFLNITRRVFSGNEKNLITDHTMLGGRYYSKAAQIPTIYRMRLLWEYQGNIYRTIEKDYKCCIPSILFGKCGISLQTLKESGKDLYYVEGEENTADLRNLAKTVAVVMIGIESEYRLRKTMKSKFDRYSQSWNDKSLWIDKNGYPLKKLCPDSFKLEDVLRVTDKIVKHYRELIPIFDKLFFPYENKGNETTQEYAARDKSLLINRLMGIESKIARIIINEFTGQDKFILCIHDSFRVLEDDAQLLEDTMLLAYRKVVQHNNIPMNPLDIKTDRQAPDFGANSIVSENDAEELSCKKRFSMEYPTFEIDFTEANKRKKDPDYRTPDPTEEVLQEIAELEIEYFQQQQESLKEYNQC